MDERERSAPIILQDGSKRSETERNPRTTDFTSFLTARSGVDDAVRSLIVQARCCAQEEAGALSATPRLCATFGCECRRPRALRRSDEEGDRTRNGNSQIPISREKTKTRVIELVMKYLIDRIPPAR